MSFSPIDWLILILSVIGVFYAGLLGRKYVKDPADFLLAGRAMGAHLGTISLVSTEIGIITYMYYAEMGVLYGFTTFIAAVIPAAVYVFLGKTGFVINKCRELNLVTIPQYFEAKYSRNVRILTGVLMAIGGVLNFGVFPIIEATFLNILTGIPKSFIILTMVVLLTMVLLYTALGGMISVLLTTYVQFIVLVVGMIIITIYCFTSVGWDQMVGSVTDRLGESGFSPLAHPAFGLNFILWQIVAWLAGLTVWAPVSIRALAAESPKVAGRIFKLTGLIFLGRAILPFTWGIAAASYLGSQEIAPIEAAPVFLRDVLPPGVKGIVVGGMVAASMSTYSGYLLAWSSVICQDVVVPIIKRPLTPKATLLMNQVTLLLVTIFIIVWGLFYVIPGATYFYLQMTGNIFLAGTFWALVAGLYWTRAHKLGAYCALIFGGGATVIYFVIPNPQEWTGVIGVASYVFALIGMVVGSLIGAHVSSLRNRLAAVGIVGLLLGSSFYIYGRFSKLELWLGFWIVVFFIGCLLFVSVCGTAIVKGWKDVKTMLQRLLKK